MASLIDDAIGIRNDICTVEGKALQTRLNVFEEKIEWLVQELRMIRETLELTTKAIQSTVSAPVLIPNKENTLQPIHPSDKRTCGGSTTEQPTAIRPYPINPKGLPGGNTSFTVNYTPSQVASGCNIGKREDYQSNGSSDEKASFPEDSENRESNSETASKSLSDEYDSDTQLERGRISRESGTDSNQGSRDWNVYSEFMTEAPQLKNLHSDAISGLDVIYLWEYGTDEMLPIRLWNEAELESGGDVIKRWQQVMEIFKVNCRGSLRAFVSKYTNADGKLMSVQDVLSPSTQDVANINSLTVPENKLSDNYSASSGSQSELSSKLGSYGGVSINGSSSTLQSLQCDPKREPCFILPRKINGQKVSAKDVIRIWEDGFCNIPPVKTWTPNQKLKQQSKISRWKKIVDIFKNECNGDMKLFELRYKNECGVLLPIAAIISKYEQTQTAVDVMEQPTMSTISSSTLDVKVDSFTGTVSDGCDNGHRNHEHWRSYRCLNELAREWDFVEAQSCKERRAFTIRQVENWQRNSIQPLENRTVSERLQNSNEALRKTLEEQGKRLVSRSMPHLNHINRRDASKVNEDADLIRAEFNGKSAQNPINRFKSGTAFTISPIIDVTACPGERKEPEESSISDSLENSSCKDIDVTGSISSESSAPSKSYSPIAPKLRKDVGTKSPTKSEPSTMNNSKGQGTSRQSPRSVGAPAPENVAQPIFQSPESINSVRCNALPESDDPIEVLNLWEHGNDLCPPIRFLALKPELVRDSRLSAWRKFLDIFHYLCNSDKKILVQKYSDDNGRLLRVSEILQKFGSSLIQRQCEASDIANGANANQGAASSFKLSQSNDRIDAKPNIYTLPRKINGHKVSAKDVIHIWHHGLKNIPPVRSWMPHQKVRQQSKISRWKKVVEIFEVDCCCNMQLFEKKYSNKSGDLLPIAAIIAKYEAEKSAIDGDSGLNIKVDSMTEM